jgi:DNA-binding MarR family transcriptional regulator
MGTRSKADLADDVWRKLFDFIVSTSSQRQQILGRYGLTPNDSRALSSLSTEGRTMQSLANEWACDPSNATFMVDRLEERKLAKRQAHADDRRVKLVVLTPTGVKTKEALRGDLYRAPPELLALDREDLERLDAAAAKLRAAS